MTGVGAAPENCVDAAAAAAAGGSFGVETET